MNQKFVTVAEMQAIEKEADASGFTYSDMMENAGRNLAEAILEKYGYLEEGGALGLVGSGNNGGDTLVALTHLAEKGWRTTAMIVRSRPANDPLIARLHLAGGQVNSIENNLDKDHLRRVIREHPILIDGILGTGIQLPLKEELAQILDKIREILREMEHPPIVVAVDCPSGVDCDSGKAAPECIPADLTVTMAAIKRGLFAFPAFNLVGEIQVVSIGLPEEGAEMESWKTIEKIVPDRDWVRDNLPVRPLNAHKGTFGTALIVAGSTNYTGAAYLAGQAAYRIGTGLVTLALPSPLHAALSGQFPEATWILLPHENGVIAEEAYRDVLDNLERATALLVGPGLGLDKTTGRFLSHLLTSHDKLPPVVIDADGLKLLKAIPDWPSRLPKPAILSPHPGEMSILTGLSIQKIQKDRLNIACRFSKEWGHVVILKGAFTVVASPDGQTAVIPVASPALARAGTGDVLAGLVVGLFAQGIKAFPSAVAAAWIHAYAGLQAAQSIGNPGSVVAGDLLEGVIQVINTLR